jgi:hypothetical protein
MGEWFSRTVTAFRGRGLPEPAVPAGYAALIDHYDLKLPLPPRLSATAGRHHPRSTPAWQLLTPRHRPDSTLAGELVFALKWEGIDLAVLAALFKSVPPGDVAAIVRATPTGAFARRIWFLYEWLTGRELDVEPAGKVRTVTVVDPGLQVATERATPSSRHRVANNLPGTPRFCPMVRRTPALDAAVAAGYDRRAREVIGRVHRDLVARAAAFLLLNDSKASFTIEGERPSGARAARWAEAIGQAGTQRLTLDELERLQRLVIGDARFVSLGLRNEGGFVGTHDRLTQEPLPEHVSARSQDLPDLVTGIIDYAERAIGGGVDAVVAAAVIAFGFVYVHPFADGNGRLHRWLVHHVLAAAGYNPPGLVFPVSAAILRRLDDYRRVLESYSAPLRSFVDWRATETGNVEVLNETADYYRYFDATAHAEFLYDSVAQTVEHDLPEEVRFLQAFDRFAAGVKELLEMPDRQVDRLRGFLQQGEGRLSKRAREQEFAALTDSEAERLEALYARWFAPSTSEP